MILLSHVAVTINGESFVWVPSGREPESLLFGDPILEPRSNLLEGNAVL